ncbi:CHAD domain-containing protein [Frigidibacter sp. ROC022]|uniref:CHAD domain-containing protein n=1 Tax=Frigidibacter sp. ROC022 TaxID=2971796 RepID=UPI00215AC6F7|nr:CHAD domain-containing protein [Frigidibacter sp. ROC022]MCR8722679.1 CHAD domain-containing protein [Frigidibacter sp. ROC022]
MPYAFQPGDATIRAAFRRIAVEQSGHAIAALSVSGPNRAARVHEARKAIKKLRALLRLFRPAFPRFRRENRALRDIGRGLAPLRDADVTTGLLADLAAETGLPVPDLPPGAAPLTPAEVETRLQTAIAGLKALRQRARGWKLDAQGFEALERGLARSWDDGRKALKRARRHGTPEAIHELRKRLKDHWYHARLLAPAWPAMIGLHRQLAGDLGEALGRHQDLAMLEPVLGNLPNLRPLLALARQQRGAILADALPQATRLYAEPGAALAARWRKYWKAADPALPRV